MRLGVGVESNLFSETLAAEGAIVFAKAASSALRGSCRSGRTASIGVGEPATGAEVQGIRVSSGRNRDDSGSNLARARSLAALVGYHDLGIALCTLGTRESGTDVLEEAVSTFHQALKERTRERVPLAWATTQMNLGTALARLGERDKRNGEARRGDHGLPRGAEERTRERVPLDWAGTQNNLGNAL
jgi:hypothetical protein